MSAKVTEWLNRLGLDQYAVNFEENAIEIGLLSDLTDSDLKEIGIAALGHRKTILKAINAAHSDRSNDREQIEAAPSDPASTQTLSVE